MFIDRDLDGLYEQCLLCCYRRKAESNTKVEPLREKVAVSKDGATVRTGSTGTGANSTTEQFRRVGRPRVTERPGFQARYTAVLQRLLVGAISRRQAARELGIGYATLKKLLDSQQ